jgi:hypothetical protein
MLTPSPEGYDACRGLVARVRMVVRDSETPNRYEPIGRSRVASPSRVALQYGVFDIRSRDTEEISLDDRVIGPGDDVRGA